MDENVLGKKLKARRKLAGLTQGELGKILHISTDYVSRLEKGERVPSERVRIDLDKFLENDSIIPYRPADAVNMMSVPVLGRISAGFPNLAEQEVVEYISIPGAPKNSFALVVKGFSMEPTFRDGDYVLFINNGEYKANDVLIVLDEWGEAMLKRLKEKDGRRFLVSDNLSYPVVEPNENFRTIGKVVKAWRDIKF